MGDIRRGLSHNIKVFMYHRIVDEGKGNELPWLSVHVEDFKKQMDILQKLNYYTVTFKDLKLHLEGKITLPEKSIIITFDDGYVDVYRLAYPAMKERGMKGVIFALGDRQIGRSSWNDKEEYEAPLMNNGQLCKLLVEGFEIGAHSMTHADLNKVSGRKAKTEIVQAKKSLESVLQQEIISFSYPYGSLNDEVRQLVADAGYQFGIGVYSGPSSIYQDYYNIRRLTVQNDTGVIGFLMRIMLPYQHLEWIYWNLKNSFFR